VEACKIRATGSSWQAADFRFRPEAEVAASRERSLKSGKADGLLDLRAQTDPIR
jgi:hypothetical protein